MMKTTRIGGWHVLCMVLASGLAALPASFALAGDGELERVRADIEAEGLGWVAGETAVSRLPGEVFRSMLLPLDGDRAAEMAAFLGGEPSSRVAAPVRPSWVPRAAPDDPVFTWRDVDGEDWTTPVRNQGLCGACTIFAAVAVIEGAANVAYGSADLDLDLSEQNLLSCTSVSCSGGGMDAAVGLNRAKSHGVPDEGCHPYTATDGNCNQGCADLAERALKVTDWGWAAGPNLSDWWKTPTVEQIKEALTHGPLSTSMTVYSDFSMYNSGVYEKTASATQEGGHAVVIIGWNDGNDSWYGKNSWGPGWGDGGYFEIKRGESGFAEGGTAWAQVDVSQIPGMMTLSPDKLAISLEFGSGDTYTRIVEVRFQGDEGEMAVGVDTGSLPGWLSVSPTSGTIGPEQTLELEFLFDEAGWPLDGVGTQVQVVGIVAGHGLARTVEARLTVFEKSAPDPDPDPDPGDPDEDGGVAAAGGGDGCGCGSAGAARPGLLVRLLALL